MTKNRKTTFLGGGFLGDLVPFKEPLIDHQDMSARSWEKGTS